MLECHPLALRLLITIMAGVNKLSHEFISGCFHDVANKLNAQHLDQHLLTRFLHVINR